MNSSSSIVTQHIVRMVHTQLSEHNIVVWFDPDHQYSEIVSGGNFPAVRLFKYDPEKGFLSLRRQLEQDWGVIEPPQMLIYVLASEADSHHALVEFSTAGVVMQPGQQPLDCNTRLAIVARQALSGIFPVYKLEKVLAEVENGQLSLAELDRIARDHHDVHIGALALIFHSDNIDEILLQFLSTSNFDEAIKSRNATATIVDLLRGELEFQTGDHKELTKTREDLRRYLLISEFMGSIGASHPASLQTFRGPQNPTALEAVNRLVKDWRSRSDCLSSYLQASKNVEKELDLTSHVWSIDLLEQAHTFSGIDEILQTLFEQGLKENPSYLLIKKAKARQTAFWPAQLPALKLRWQLIVEAGQVLLQSKTIRDSLKPDWPAKLLISKYVSSKSTQDGGNLPWCLLDTTFRRMERDEHNFDFEGEQHNYLRKLMASARFSYIETAHKITEQFILSYRDEGFHLPDIIQQANIFQDFVQTSLEESKTAYILVDSFRYEMAVDLMDQIQQEWDCQLTPALAAVPTITEVGMAALLPEAQKGISLLPAGAGKLGVSISNTLLKSRSDRLKFIEAKFPQSIALELSQIAPLKDKKVINSLAHARLTVITATDEIDGLWENQPEIARRLHEDVFIQLYRGIRALFNNNYQTIIIASDHGFLAGENLMMGEPMDPPRGDTVDLHRRVWIGRGGVDIPTCVRKPVSAFGLGGDLELVTPIGLGCFKAPGGSTQYYHGGLSLQEVIIPVLKIHPGKGHLSKAMEPSFTWEVIPGSSQVSTRFFSMTIKGYATELIAMPPRIRVELRAADQVYSIPVSATYGFDEITRDITMKLEEGSTTLQPNIVNVLINDLPPGLTCLNLYLINSESGLTLSQIIDIPVSLAI